MAKQGGYQPPRNPAPVSGPGPMSRRTDGPGQPSMPLPNPAYGEGKDFMGIQAGAKMSQSSGPNPLAGITPLTEASQRPDEPVTAGAPSGPGPGTGALGLPNPAAQRAADIDALAQYMPLMEQYVNSGVSSGTMKSFLRYLRSQSS